MVGTGKKNQKKKGSSSFTPAMGLRSQMHCNPPLPGKVSPASVCRELARRKSDEEGGAQERDRMEAMKVNKSRIEEETDGASQRGRGWRALICLAHDAKSSKLDL